MKANIFEANTIFKKAKNSLGVSFLFELKVLNREH